MLNVSKVDLGGAAASLLEPTGHRKAAGQAATAGRFGTGGRDSTVPACVGGQLATVSPALRRSTVGVGRSDHHQIIPWRPHNCRVGC